MANSISGILNGNIKGNNGVGMPLTIEKQITLIVHNRSGEHNNHQIGLEISGDPAGDGAFQDVSGSVIVGPGIITVNHSAGYVKAKTFKAEGADSQSNIEIIAR